MTGTLVSLLSSVLLDLSCLVLTCGDPDPVLSLGDLRIAPDDGDTRFSAVFCLVGLVMSCAYLR